MGKAKISLSLQQSLMIATKSRNAWRRFALALAQGQPNQAEANAAWRDLVAMGEVKQFKSPNTYHEEMRAKAASLQEEHASLTGQS